jgi:Kdo2-lipid IVA lauroyltransferase/acyltransferase
LKRLIAILAELPLYLLSLLPLRVLYVLAHPLYFFAYYIIGYRKSVVRMNMYACFPDSTSAQIYQWQKQFFQQLSRFVAEVIKGVSANEVFFKERVSVDGKWLDLLQEYHRQGRHVIILTGHYGNWEWAAARLSAIQEFRKYLVYRPQSKLTDIWMQWLRKKGDTILLPENNIRTVYKTASEQACLLVMAADQTPVQTTHSKWVTFLGLLTPFHPGPEKIAKALDAVVWYAAVKPLTTGSYHIDFLILTEHAAMLPEGKMTRQYAGALENTIQQNPPYWLWSHRRWKRANIPGL